MDNDMTPDIQKQIDEANVIFDEGKHFDAQSRKARHPIGFVLEVRKRCSSGLRVPGKRKTPGMQQPRASLYNKPRLGKRK